MQRNFYSCQWICGTLQKEQRQSLAPHQAQKHSPMVSSRQKTHSGVTFLCNDKSTGPEQDAVVGLLPGHHI